MEIVSDQSKGEGNLSGNWLKKSPGNKMGALFYSARNTDSQQDQFNSIQALIYIFFFFAGLFWIISLFLKSEGAINQDEIGHLLIAKNAWFHPSFLLDEWGRFINTLLYLIPSLFGLTGARIFSIILSCLTVIITTQVSKFFEVKYYFLIPVFLWFQPFFGAYAFSTLTEIPFSFILILTILLSLKNKHVAASVLIGLLPLVRHEAILLTGLWCLYYLYSRRYKCIFFSFVPLILYILLYFLVNQEFVYKIFFEPKPTDMYGSGDWFHFFKNLPDWVGISLLLLSVAGLAEITRYGLKALIFLGGYLLYYLTHIIIWKFALYSSGGYYDVLIPLAPAFAILSSLGIKLIIRIVDNLLKMKVNNQAVKVLILSIIIPFVIAHGARMSAPYGPDEEQLLMKQVASNIENTQMPFTKVISTHVWFYYYYFYNRAWTNEESWVSPPDPKNIRPGTIVVWDAHFSDRFGLNIAELIDSRNNFERIMTDRSGKVIVFYKL